MEPVNSTVLVGVNLRAAQEHELLTELAEHVAYLQLGSPSLRSVLDERHAAGDACITLVPANLHGERAALSWLRRVAAHWVRTVPQPPQVRLVATVLTAPEDFPAVFADPGEPLTDAAPLYSPAWERLPGYRHHLLVCRGPRCGAHGSERTAAAIKAALKDNDLGDDDVLVTQTACLFPCNHGPVVAVHPDDVWYGQVGEAEAHALVTGHLCGGRPVRRLRLLRGEGGATG